MNKPSHLTPLLISFIFILEQVSSITPDHKRHDISIREEYDAFENDLIASIPHDVKAHEEHLHRTKRFIYLNTVTYMACALLIGVPVSLVLPTLSNLFNKFRRRKRRSVENNNDDDPFATLLDEDDDDPLVRPELVRISTYFNLVDIPEHSCQLRAICEFSANPEKYYPLSDMILSRVRNPKLPPMIYIDNEQTSNNTAPTSKGFFRLYNTAANAGLEKGGSQCVEDYGEECGYSMDKLLNMPTLRFWTAMQRFLQLKFTDGGTTF